MTVDPGWRDTALAPAITMDNELHLNLIRTEHLKALSAENLRRIMGNMAGREILVRRVTGSTAV